MIAMTCPLRRGRTLKCEKVKNVMLRSIGKATPRGAAETGRRA
jgi:hypothetical protein